MSELISLKKASKLRGHRERDAYLRAREGRLPHVIETPAGRTRWLITLEDYDRDIAALVCAGPGCERPTSGAGSYCEHACSVRKYAVEERPCPNCGDTFQLEGHIAKDKEEHCCSVRCAQQYRRKTKPETFPQPRGKVVTCRCGAKTEYKAPAHLGVTHCEHCKGERVKVWWESDAGDAEKDRSRERQRVYWTETREEAAGLALDLGRVLTSDIVAATQMSVPTLTRHYVERRGDLEVEAVAAGGQTFFAWDPNAVGAWDRSRTGEQKVSGRLGGAIAAVNGGSNGRPPTVTEEELALVVGQLKRGGSIRGVAQNTGVSKKQVERIRASLRTVP